MNPGPAGETPRRLITVLGASGFVGTAVTRALAAAPVRLRLVSRRPAPVPAHAVADVEVYQADLAEPGAVAATVAGSDVVVHLVAHIQGTSTWRVDDGDEMAERLNLGTVREVVAALRAGRDPRRPLPIVVFAGSLSQVGKHAGGPITGREPDVPETAYDRLKLAAERELAAATEEGVLRGITLRLATVHGAGTVPSALERGVVAAMMRRALAGEPLTLWHDGTVARDLVRVDDVARAFVAAVGNADELAGRSWLIGTGVPISVGELFRRVAEAVSVHTGQPPVPVVTTPSEHAGASDLTDVVCGSTAFSDVTGWQPDLGLTAALAAAVPGFAAEREGGVRPAR